MDEIDHPSHYQGKRFEAIDYNLNFNLGNAIKYILRSGKKGPINEDLKKAIWYLNREIEKNPPIEPDAFERVRVLDKYTQGLTIMSESEFMKKVDNEDKND